MVFRFNRFDYWEDEIGLHPNDLEESKKRLSKWNNKISSLESRIERLMYLRDNLDTLNDLEFFKIAQEFYIFYWQMRDFNYYYNGKLEKEDKELKQFLEALMNIGEEKFGICSRTTVEPSVSRCNYYLSDKSFTLNYSLGGELGRTYFSRYKIESILGSSYYDYVGENVTLQRQIPILYYARDMYGEERKFDSFNLSSETTKKRILDGHIFVLSFPSEIPFPLEYSVVKDLDENSLECVYRWLAKESSVPKGELNGYQQRVLDALKTFLIPLLKAEISKRISEDIEGDFRILERLKLNYNYLLRSYISRLEAEAKRLEFK